MENEQITLEPGYKPKTGKLVLLSFQHIFAMFSATILVPMLTGLPISVALFSSGVGTLIYILCTKGKVPIYLGSSFAYITYILFAAGITKNEAGEIIDVANGYGPALSGLVVVGLVYCIIAVIIKYAGIKWLKRLLPPVIIGPMIIIIGLGLASNAVGNTGITRNGDWRSIVVALTTVLVIAFTAIKAKGFLKVVPFLIGIISGYVVAVVLHLSTSATMGAFMNFDSLSAVLASPKEWFKLPELMILGNADKELFAGISMYKFSLSAAISVIPLAFVTICEHIGDHEVLGNITHKDYLENPGLHRTLLGDGIATMFAGLIGGPANTSYGENTSVVGISKIGSVYVTGGAAIIAILLSFCNIFTTFISSIPTAVMGGTCLILYGFIASNGLKTLFDAKVDMTKTRNLIIVSVMLVIGLGGAEIKLNDVSSFTGMALAAIFGIILNLILPNEKNLL